MAYFCCVYGMRGGGDRCIFANGSSATKMVLQKRDKKYIPKFIDALGERKYSS